MPDWRKDAVRREKRSGVPMPPSEQPKTLRRMLLEFLVGGGLATAVITVAGPELSDYLGGDEPICENAHDAAQTIKSVDTVPPELRPAYYAYVQRQLAITVKCDMEFGS